MTISNPSYLKGFHDVSRAMGDKVISSDFTLEIDGFEQNYLLCKQAPWPELSSAGEIEVPMPLGAVAWQPQQAKTNLQGPISFYETVAGHIDNMLMNMIMAGGKFDATVYDGTPQRFLKAKRIKQCFMQIDSPDRDWENRAQVLLYAGTIFYHYYGEIIPGNSGDYS
ncbi:hypothetical protein SAMN05216302_10467 [Nitrosomonas aestuarii]|uniref:Uncharacterized protein n=1 Tax=Nitrosomonas aestuarii TaxID=52441 RepID=A0A1I4G278_9PROT|nr:hypothetical protein [Nitrosomonas aestuarii]SFL23813.1 hypothetical protein SAMN05216302_10467 [Nitrosomonas aestuarii]